MNRHVAGLLTVAALALGPFAQLHGVGARVEEPGLGLIELHPFSSPYEDLRLRK